MYVVPSMSVFLSFEFDKDKIYARHLSSDEGVAKIYHFKSSIQHRERITVRRGSPDLKEIESCSSVSSQQVFSQKFPDNECNLSKRMRMKITYYPSVFISSCVTSLCNNNRCDEVGDDKSEINEENDLSTTLKGSTKSKLMRWREIKQFLPLPKRRKIKFIQISILLL
jgi:hypothetical protein